MNNQTTVQIQDLLRRPDVAGALRFRSDGNRKDIRFALALSPKELSRMVEEASKLVSLFPSETLQGSQKAVYRKMAGAELSTVLRAYARALKLCPEVKGSTEAAETLARKIGKYQNLQECTARIVNTVLDLRILLGALQWYLLRSVLAVVVQRMEDPSCPRAEAEELRDRFSALLLKKERLLRSMEESTKRNKAQLATLQKEQKEVEKRALVADTMHALRMGYPVDRKTLEQAAIYYFEGNPSRKQRKAPAKKKVPARRKKG